MGRPILRLATRLDRRTRWTAWAIAFACMVLVGSLSLVEGLTAGVDDVTSRFDRGPAVYIRGPDLLSSSIDANALVSLPVNYSALRLHTAILSMNGAAFNVLVASWEIHSDGTASILFPAGAADAVSLDVGLRDAIVAETGQPINATVDLTVFGASHPALPVAPPPSPRPELFPDDWAWIHPDLFLAINPVAGGPLQAIVTESPLEPSVVASLGLSRLATIGALSFVQGSAREARAAFDVLAVVIAIIIGLLVYATMGLEVHERAKEIRTLRSIGAAPATVAAIFEGRAIFLAVLGAVLGSALGIVAAHVVVSFAPLVGLPNLVLLSPPVDAVAIAFLLAIVAAAVGGLVPSRRATVLSSAFGEARPS